MGIAHSCPPRSAANVTVSHAMLLLLDALLEVTAVAMTMIVIPMGIQMLVSAIVGE